jgi:hypothetical protein
MARVIDMTTDSLEAPRGRFDYEGESILRQFFSPDDLRLHPEEYVARHSHEWGCFSFHFYRYGDVELGNWIRSVGELLFKDGEVERCRMLYLTPTELAEVRCRESEGF